MCAPSVENTSDMLSVVQLLVNGGIINRIEILLDEIPPQDLDENLYNFCVFLSKTFRGKISLRLKNYYEENYDCSHILKLLRGNWWDFQTISNRFFTCWWPSTSNIFFAAVSITSWDTSTWPRIIPCYFQTKALKMFQDASSYDWTKTHQDWCRQQRYPRFYTLVRFHLFLYAWKSFLICLIFLLFPNNWSAYSYRM